MEREAAREIIECLGKGRTLFYYFRGRYALMLLSYVVGEGASVRELKGTRYGKLLGKPVMREVLRRSGDGRITREGLQAVWPSESECYLLTLDTWSGDGGRWACWQYDQTSRRGTNLVLQLNFSNKHDRVYERFIHPAERDPFVRLSHPVCEAGRHTLAWSRIDLDLDGGEALIEEIQSDWVKLALRKREALAAIERDGERRARELRWVVRHLECSLEELSRYVERALGCHMRMWSEAMLAATVWFLREELGVRTIYYHTHETGAQLKGIRYDLPPKSLYTTLPRQFLFEETDEAPGFLRQGKHKRLRRVLEAGPRFYVLRL